MVKIQPKPKFSQIHKFHKVSNLNEVILSDDATNFNNVNTSERAPECQFQNNVISNINGDSVINASCKPRKGIDKDTAIANRDRLFQKIRNKKGKILPHFARGSNLGPLGQQARAITTRLLSPIESRTPESCTGENRFTSTVVAV
jgi:hypothetical protein